MTRQEAKRENKSLDEKIRRFDKRVYEGYLVPIAVSIITSALVTLIYLAVTK